jgi:hypothetical protein
VSRRPAPDPRQRFDEAEEAPPADIPAPSTPPPSLVKQPANPFGSPTSKPDAAQRPSAASGFGAPPAPTRATPGLLVAAVGALITFLAAFLTWASVEVSSRVGGPIVGGGTRSVSGLEGDRLGKATLVVAIAALLLIGLLLAPASRRWGWIALAVAGGLILVLALLDLVSIADASDLRSRLAQVPGCSAAVQCTGDRSAGIGIYLTLLGGLLVGVGAFLHAGMFTKLVSRLPRRSATPPKAAA